MSVVTKETLPKNRKEYGELILRKLYEEKLPCFGGQEGGCMYRLGDKACVAGLLILDENYSERIEDKPFSHEAVVDRVTIPEGVTEENIRKLQTMHDRYAHGCGANNDFDPITREEFVGYVRKLLLD